MTTFFVRSILHTSSATFAITVAACGGLAAPPDSSAQAVDPGRMPLTSHAAQVPATPTGAAPAAKSEADMYHVYKRENGTCEVDMRSHEQEQSARGGHPQCLGHFTSNSSAMELRDKMTKDGACKR